MKRTLKITILAVLAAVVLAACAGDSDTSAQPAANASEVVATSALAPPSVAETQVTTPAEPAMADAAPALPGGVTRVTLGNTSTVEGAGALVTAAGVSITTGGTYVLSGALDGGMVEVNAPNADVTLLLDGVSIVNPTGPAILFVASSASHITLVDGTVNTLEDGGEHDAHDATLWSAATLTIGGTGALRVTGHYQEGIASEMHININGGNIWVDAFDDGLNANNDDVSIVTVNGGSLFITSGGDGIDSNGTIAFNGGTTIAMSALTDRSGGLDADGAITINGGLVIGTGARNSIPAAASVQESLVVNYDSAQSAGTPIAILDANDAPLLLFVPAVAYQQLVFSSPEVAEGVSYTVYSGGTVAGGTVSGGTGAGAAVNGLYVDALYTPGRQVTTVDSTSAAADGNGRPGGTGGNRP